MFAFVVSLEHHTDSDERFLSGIDTRGSSANCYFKSDNNGGAASQIIVFAECTSSLKIMANKVELEARCLPVLWLDVLQ